MKLRIELTPIGHYFLGTERNFKHKGEEGVNRQASEGYFIRSKKIPSQTTLFGTLRYLIGVDDQEKLKENWKDLIGSESFDVTKTGQEFGVIQKVSPLYLFSDREDGYFIRTPLDQTVKTKDSEGKEIDAEPYLPFSSETTSNQSIQVYDFPEKSIQEKSWYVNGYDAKAGLAESWMSVDGKKIIQDSEVFKSSVEVVSDKSKKQATGKDDEAFAKKEYIRLAPGYHFVFFADLDEERLKKSGLETDESFKKLIQHKEAVLGKDSSAFAVGVRKAEEPVITCFQNRTDFIYLQSDYYVAPGFADGSEGTDLYRGIDLAVTETETMRIFVTSEHTLRPKKESALINLVKAGSVLYRNNSGEDNGNGFLKPENGKINQAEIAGMNRVIYGGNKL